MSAGSESRLKAQLFKKIKVKLQKNTQQKRLKFIKQMQSRLKNTAPSIICNNCVGGAIYRDLGLPYLSPTANVLIKPNDFTRFVNDLEYYLNCTPEEIFIDGITYPVGVLKKGEEQVVLHFMHDGTFEKGKEKWLRRCQRVDLDNLYVIFHSPTIQKLPFLHKLNPLYKRFKGIKHPKKRMLAKVLFSFNKEIVPLRKSVFFRKKYAMDYPTKFSQKRLMDDFDYVSFLNN